jgi:hypothetical protein
VLFAVLVAWVTRTGADVDPDPDVESGEAAEALRT